MHPWVRDGVNVAVRAAVMPWSVAARWSEAGRIPSLRALGRPAQAWPLAAKVAADEFFYLSELLAGAPYAFGESARLMTELDQAATLFERRGWSREPAAYHRTPPPPSAVTLAASTTPGLAYEQLSFESGYEPWPDEPGRDRWLAYTPNRTAHAWLVRHPGPPRPWFVCIPGYRMGRLLFDFVGFRIHWLHRHLGLNVAVPVLPFHGPRRVGRRSGDGYLTGDFVDTVHAQAQTLWDVRRLIAWVRTEGTPAVGVYGLSLGGYSAAMLAALEDDLACVVAGMAPVDFAGLLRDNSPGPLVRATEWWGFPWATVDRVLRVVSPLALPRRVPRERCFLFAGVADGLAPPAQTRALWRHWGRPRLAWYRGGHVSFVVEAAVHELLCEALDATGLSVDAGHAPSGALGWRAPAWAWPS
jgi:hypothetical protein